MKVTVLPIFVAALGLASQASASPLRIYVLGHEGSSSAVVAGKDGQSEQLDAAVAPLRWGHPAAGAQHQEEDDQAPKPMVVYTHTEVHEGEDGESEDSEENHHRIQKGEHPFHMKGEGHHFRPNGRRPKLMGMGCGRDGLRAKAFALQNWLRSKFGMENIEPFHRHRPDFKSGSHDMWQPPVEVDGDEHGPKHMFPHPPPHLSEMEDGEEVHHRHHRPQFSEMEDDEGRVDHPHHAHGMHHFRRPHSFGGRLTKALMTLGPWEGRAVAFVLGLGIGSLIRMLYVLCVLAFRSRRRNDEVEEVHVIFDTVEPRLPRYTDEKEPIEEAPRA